MDVCNQHVNNMTLYEENLLRVKLDWKKIGEVHSNSRRQCLIVCMVCESFDSAYTTNDASAFWEHVQTQHLDYPLFKDDKTPEYNTEVRLSVGITNTDNNALIAESMKTSSIAHPNNSLLPEKNYLGPNTNQNPLETIPDINNTSLPDREAIDSNATNCQVVAISDDEDVTTDCKIQDNQNSDHSISAIELSEDEEELRPTKEMDSTFATCLKELYSCELCGDLFIDQETLHEHKMGHNDIRVNNDMPISKFQELTETSTTTTEPHLNTDVIQNYRCRFCRFHFATIELLERHQSMHAEKRDCQEGNHIQCKVCGEHFNSLPLLSIHERNEHMIGLYEELISCVQCQKIVPKSNLELHIRKCHPNTNLQNISPPDSIVRPPSNSRAYKCSICGRRTTTEESMAVHHQRFHSSTIHPNTTKCTICSKIISYRYIHIHMASVHGDVEKIKCPFCGRWYRSRRNYELHLEQVHPTNMIPQDTLPQAHIVEDSVSSSSLISQPANITHPQAHIVEDSVSSSSLTSQPANITEQNSEFSASQYEESYDDEIISYAELIPMDCTQSSA